MNASDLTHEMDSLPAYSAIAFACRCLRRVRALCCGFHNAEDLAPADHMLQTCNAIVFGGDYGDTSNANRRCEALDRLAREVQKNGGTIMATMLRRYVEGVACVGRGLSIRESGFGLLTDAVEYSQKAVGLACDCCKEYTTQSDYYKTYETHKFDLDSVPRSLRNASDDDLIETFHRDLRDIMAIASRLDLKMESTVPEHELELL